MPIGQRKGVPDLAIVWQDEFHIHLFGDLAQRPNRFG
jgi:hypothetical protein